MKQAREYIKELLDKFLEGQTTEAEEQILSKYFCEANDISPAWLKYKQLFMSFKTDAYDFSKEEIDALLIPNQLKKPSVIPLWTLVSAVSAAVVLLLLVWHPWIGDKVNAISPIARNNSVDVAETKTRVDEVKTHEEPDVQITQKTYLLSETKSPVSKTPKEKCRKHFVSEPLKVQETSASEMIDIVYTLADLSPDDVNINVSPVCNGFAVNTTDGNSYIMKLSAEGTLSLEQTS